MPLHSVPPHSVRVRAVVMTRDDSSGGWVPLGGGGLSHVIICRGRSSESRGRREYVIRGERLRDRAPVLECTVQKGLVYNKVNPIFHHWRVEERKFGLTFQSPADAISFEKGLQSVLDKLDRGSDSPSSSTPEEGDTEDDGQASHTGSESSSNSRKEMLPKPITIVTSESSSTCFVRSSAEEFGYGAGHAVTTQTPAQVHTRPTQHQLSQVAAVLNPPAPPPPPPAPPTPPLAPPASSPLSPLSPTISLLEEGDLHSLDPCKDLWGSRGYEDYRRAGATRTKVGGLTGGVVVGGGPDKSELCVVRFEKELAGVGITGCEVTVMLDTKGSQHHSSPTCMPNAVPGSSSAGGSPQETGKGSPSPCCIHTSLATPRSRTRKRGGGAGTGGGADAISPDDDSPCPQGSSSCSSRCVYCRSVFSASENGRGRCRDAPDPALHCLRQWTCVWCAESLLYHCMSDSEGEFWEPCSCEDSMGHRPHPLCCARWMALLALSLFVPCMCCYLPLRACLRCGERCGCCGGKHKAVR
ncbi:sprouty-related, EVH1 domain-containing protein 3 isoform X1 [Astyanax mexicanus]|uniref:Sprouty-related, EVH1 domain-containing protein 3 isoform X1 n=2 Tax=Astyanax mexicanus TaxID=7994 RepID=A0A8T2LWW0_ASTMX|nr:sprouty-related, EVH1 domain-containing protein 3 isoform X1 [Astyanax mexicanus]KAG9273303.1 sprouty-related, EVH1 domain-containing protein 3 isoform X1 [Astyanax mexicanus]